MPGTVENTELCSIWPLSSGSRDGCIIHSRIYIPHLREKQSNENSEKEKISFYLEHWENLIEEIGFELER